MSSNNDFMTKIAAAMGMKVGDRFHLRNEEGEIIDWCNEPYIITENGPVDCEGCSLGYSEQSSFFAGRFEKIESDPIDEKLRHIEEELELMGKDFKELADELNELKEQLH